MLAEPFRKALQSERTRAVLSLLAESDEGKRYSDLRRALVESGHVRHPVEFQRAVDALMNCGLVQSRVLPKRLRPRSEPRYVILEATILGKVLWRYETLKDEALRKAAAEFGMAVDQLPVQV